MFDLAIAAMRDRVEILTSERNRHAATSDEFKAKAAKADDELESMRAAIAELEKISEKA